MTCVKTGCVAYLVEHGEWVYGDAFTYPGEYAEILVIRCCWRSRDSSELAEFSNLRHFTINRLVSWWDEEKTSMKQNSTLLATVWVYHGSEGIRDPQTQELAP